MQNYNWIRELEIKKTLYKIQEWLKYYYLYKYLIIISIIGGAFLGYYRAKHFQPLYTATLSFVIEEDKGGGMSGALGLASAFGIDLGTSAGGAFTSLNLIELMKSRRILSEALLAPIFIENKEISLIDYYIEFNNISNTSSNKKSILINFPPNLNKNDLSFQQDSLLGEIYESLIDLNNPTLTVLQKDKKTNVIYISVKSKNEKFAKYFTENVATKTAEFYTDTKTRKAYNNVIILKKQVDSIRGELNNAINGVAVGNDYTFKINPSLNKRKTSVTQRQVDVQANTAILTSLVTNLELANISLRKETPLIQIIDKPAFPLKKESIKMVDKIVKYSFVFFLLNMIALTFYKIYKTIIIPNI